MKSEILSLENRYLFPQDLVGLFKCFRLARQSAYFFSQQGIRRDELRLSLEQARIFLTGDALLKQEP